MRKGKTTVKEAFYGRIHEAVTVRPWLQKTVMAAAKLLPLCVYVCYPLMLAYLMIYDREYLAEAVVYPAAGFLSVTMLRAGINAPRPYETMNLPPITPKETRGKSFPSRHAACAGVIAVTALKVLPPVGVLLSALAVGIAVSRVLSGVHYIRDVVAGLLFGAVIGWIGLFA